MTPISTPPNWADIRAQLEKKDADTIGGVCIAALKTTLDVLERHWDKRPLSKHATHIRPKDEPHWNTLPHAIEIKGTNVIVLGKPTPIADPSKNQSTFKKVRLAADLNNLHPVIHATIRFEDVPRAGADKEWIKKTTKRESKIHEALGKKPGFVDFYHSCKYYAKFKKEKNPDIVKKMGITMKFCNAGDLWDSRERVCSSIKNTLNIVKDMCIILTHLHDDGIIHRDIKSNNLFLTESENGTLSMNLGDHGFANEIADEIERLLNPQEGIGGTEDYFAPEIHYCEVVKAKPQTEGLNEAVKLACDHRTDIWSMGIVLYHLLIGANPSFAGQAILKKDRNQDNRWIFNIDLELKDKLVRENCLDALQKHDLIRDFLFKMVSQMLTFHQEQRITGPELLKQFQAFEAEALASIK